MSPDWRSLGWRWCSRSGRPHLWNVHLPGGWYGAAAAGWPPPDAVLPGEPCRSHGAPPATRPSPGAASAPSAAAPHLALDDAEIRPGLNGWVSLVVPERRLRGWLRAARAAGVEVGPSRPAGRTRDGELAASLPVRPASVARLLGERRARVLSRARVVAADEAGGHEPPRTGR